MNVALGPEIPFKVISLYVVFDTFPWFVMHWLIPLLDCESLVFNLEVVAL